MPSTHPCGDILDRKAKSRLSGGQALYGREFLDFGDDEIKTAVGLYRKYLGERSLAFELSFLRIMGLLSALRRFCWRDPADGPARGGWTRRNTPHPPRVCGIL